MFDHIYRRCLKAGEGILYKQNLFKHKTDKKKLSMLCEQKWATKWAKEEQGHKVKNRRIHSPH